MKATLVSRICVTFLGTKGQIGQVQLAPQIKCLGNYSALISLHGQLRNYVLKPLSLSSVYLLYTPEAGVLDEPYSAKPAQQLSGVAIPARQAT